jgi:hypothetical protein
METLTQFFTKYQTAIEIMLYISTGINFGFVYTFLKNNEKSFAFITFLGASAGVFALYSINQ